MTSTTATKPAAKMNKVELIEFLKAADAYQGHSRDNADQLRDVVAHMQGADAEAEAPAHDPDPATMAELAQAEYKALKAWKKAGGEGAAPATPNLDELNRQHAAGTTAAERKANGNGKARKERTPRFDLGTLPVGAKTGTCISCGEKLPAAKFPKAVIDGKRQPNQRAGECRACRKARRGAA